MKQQSFQRFLLTSLLVGALCFLTALAVHQFFFPSRSFVGVYTIIPFVMLVTVVVHYVLIRASKNPRTFVGKFVAFSGLKLLVFLIAILIYAFGVKNEVVIFMLSFLITYFVFTILEISAILKFLKKIGTENT